MPLWVCPAPCHFPCCDCGLNQCLGLPQESLYHCHSSVLLFYKNSPLHVTPVNVCQMLWVCCSKPLIASYLIQGEIQVPKVPYGCCSLFPYPSVDMICRFPFVSLFHPVLPLCCTRRVSIPSPSTCSFLGQGCYFALYPLGSSLISHRSFLKCNFIRKASVILLFIILSSSSTFFSLTLS